MNKNMSSVSSNAHYYKLASAAGQYRLLVVTVTIDEINYPQVKCAVCVVGLPFTASQYCFGKVIPV